MFKFRNLSLIVFFSIFTLSCSGPGPNGQTSGPTPIVDWKARPISVSDYDYYVDRIPSEVTFSFIAQSSLPEYKITIDIPSVTIFWRENSNMSISFLAESERIYTVTIEALYNGDSVKHEYTFMVQNNYSDFPASPIFIDMSTYTGTFPYTATANFQLADDQDATYTAIVPKSSDTHFERNGNIFTVYFDYAFQGSFLTQITTSKDGQSRTTNHPVKIDGPVKPPDANFQYQRIIFDRPPLSHPYINAWVSAQHDPFSLGTESYLLVRKISIYYVVKGKNYLLKSYPFSAYDDEMQYFTWYLTNDRNGNWSTTQAFPFTNFQFEDNALKMILSDEPNYVLHFWTYTQYRPKVPDNAERVWFEYQIKIVGKGLIQVGSDSWDTSWHVNNVSTNKEIAYSDWYDEAPYYHNIVLGSPGEW